jgi:hypothetical protein
VEYLIFFSIYHWDNFSDKSKCFNYGDFVSAREIEDIIGDDVGIVPTLMDNIPIRDYGDSNKVWTELVNILRSRICDRYLHIKGPMSTIGPLANMCRFSAETRAWFRCKNEEKIHNHLNQSKLKI